jgi:acetolactate synthase-1/2/3 large subunit
MAQPTPLPSEVAPYARPGTRAAVQILRAFADRGVRVAFGIPGAAVGPLFDALSEVPEIDLVTTRHESTAVFAAIGHARATGVPALVLVTSGPGVTNTITGIASAHVEDIPVIVLGGDVAMSWALRGAFQDSSPGGLDVVSLVRGVTRFTTTVLAPSLASGAAARAWAAATGSRPGPVFLSVPYDVAQGTIAQPAAIADASAAPPLRPNEDACRAAATIFSRAKRPLLVLGSGARNATAAAIEFAEKANAPVVVTAHAKGVFPETHPLYLGLIGNAGHPSAHEYVASRPDVVCVAGSRLGDFATNGWHLVVGGHVATIQIDRDPLLIGRNAPVSLGIVGDAGTTLGAICAELVETSRIRRPSALRRQPWSANAPQGTVKPQHAVVALESAFAGATFCSDIGEHMGFAQHYLTIDSPERFHCMVGLGSMGSGLGAAIGIKHAKPNERVLVFVGDGGFNMHVSDLLTCVERHIGVIFAVFNDGCWNMVEHGFRAVFRRRPGAMPSHVANLADVARGYGADACVIDDPAQLDEERLRALVRPRVPLVLDIRIDRSESLSGARSTGLDARGA